MKKFLTAAVVAALAFPAVAFAQGNLKVGTVDMNRAFKEYNKTKDAEAKINDAKNAAKKEYDDRAESYKKALDEINNLNKQLEAPALSADAKTAKAKERDEKIANIKNMEREINEFRQTRERQLQEQALRMREGIVKEITDVVMDKVKANNFDLVFDKSGMSLNGVPLLMYSRDNVEFTNDIVAVLNKPGRATSAADTGAAASPATALSSLTFPARTHAATPRVFLFLRDVASARTALLHVLAPNVRSSADCVLGCVDRRSRGMGEFRHSSHARSVSSAASAARAVQLRLEWHHRRHG
jgi:outer membrane protein